MLADPGKPMNSPSAQTASVWRLRADLGGLLVTGTLGRMWLFGRLSGRHLTVSVALALIGVGVWYGYLTLANH